MECQPVVGKVPAYSKRRIECAIDSVGGVNTSCKQVEDLGAGATTHLGKNEPKMYILLPTTAELCQNRGGGGEPTTLG